MEQHKPYSGAGLTMPDAYDEKLIAAKDYLKSEFPDCRIGDFARDEEFLLGVTTRSFRIECGSVSNVITLAHQFFRDTKAALVIGRLRALGVAEAARSHPELQVFVLRDRVRLAEPAARNRHATTALTGASLTATGDASAGAGSDLGEDPAVLLDRLRFELQQAHAELKALGEQAIVRSDEALAEIRRLERAVERLRADRDQLATEVDRLGAVAARQSGDVAALSEQVASMKRTMHESPAREPVPSGGTSGRTDQTAMAGNRRPARLRWRNLDLLLAVVLVGLGILVGGTVGRGNDAMPPLLFRAEAMSAAAQPPRSPGSKTTISKVALDLVDQRRVLGRREQAQGF